MSFSSSFSSSFSASTSSRFCSGLRRVSRFALHALALVTVCAVVVGCGVDNSGGEAPAGTDVSIQSPGLNLDPCFAGDAAALLDSDAAVDAWVDRCNLGDSLDDKRVTLKDAVTALQDGQKLVAVSMELGGCVQQWNFMGIYQDGTTLNVWVLKEDTSYGLNETACTDDLGSDEAFFIAAEGDVADATSAELTVGIFNPDLPGAPALPGN